MKTGEPGEKTLEQGQEPTSNSTHILRWVQESNAGHIGERRALSPLRHPCSQIIIITILLLLFLLLLIKLLFHFFHRQVAQLDQELVRVTALQVVFDLLLLFGLEAFKVNASVPELEHDEPSTADSEHKNSDAEDDENEEDNEKEDDDNVQESQASITDTAASVLTILTGLLESEVIIIIVTSIYLPLAV